MRTTTTPAGSVRHLIEEHRTELVAVLNTYRATNPRLFGSIARGDATPSSDIDLLVDLLPDHRRSRLLRLSGIAAEFEDILGRRVDVATPDLLRDRVAETAAADLIPL